MIGNQITGVILAGGRSSRMGQDKGLVEINGLPLFAYIGIKLEPQVSKVWVSCNQNQQRYAARYPVVADTIADFAGPLSGMLAALIASETAWIACVPCDVPSFPDDLVERLWANKGQAAAVYAADPKRPHPALCLLNKSLIPQLQSYLEKGERKVMLFFAQCNAAVAVFDNPDNFANLNTPDDVALWQASREEKA